MGTGSMTGRRAGFCAGYGAPGYANLLPGRGGGAGFGRGRGGGGRGGGRGWRNMVYATGLPGWQRAAAAWPMTGGVPSHAEPATGRELEALKIQAANLEGALGEIRSRLQDLEARKAAD